MKLCCIYVHGKSNKFWEFEVTVASLGHYHVTYRWGRRGAKVQSKVDVYRKRSSAVKDALAKFSKKLEKGYVPEGPVSEPEPPLSETKPIESEPEVRNVSWE